MDDMKEGMPQSTDVRGTARQLSFEEVDTIAEHAFSEAEELNTYEAMPKNPALARERAIKELAILAMSKGDTVTFENSLRYLKTMGILGKKSAWYLRRSAKKIKN